uniref:Endoplasmic reticulum junction formation protein lunapark n=1 Tax=Corethrella appendiculata TaxID=1370023 RepID=U5EPS4_9DIPT
MGAIISKFRKEKTTYQILETLEEKITDIEQYTISTQERQKRFVANFLIISIGLYVLSFLTFYFVFFPPTWNERILHSLPLLICPLLIHLSRKLLGWYFQRKVNKNSTKLSNLRAEKKKILERVMDKETYKVAVEILNKFGDKSTNCYRPQTQSTSALTPIKANQPITATPKSAPLQPQSSRIQSIQRPIMPPPASPNLRNRFQPQTPIQSPYNVPQLGLHASVGSQSQQQSQQLLNRSLNNNQMMPYRRTPYPIINHNNKNVVEKMVDYLIGDGPSNRFAMICKDCFSHNGMALQEEYEYAAFRCAFCGILNPAKKLRPTAPKLPFEQQQISAITAAKEDSSSSGAPSSRSNSRENSDKDSGSDNEELFDKKNQPNTEENVEETITSSTNNIADESETQENLTNFEDQLQETVEEIKTTTEEESISQQSNETQENNQQAETIVKDDELKKTD